jgi:hypothetical protein
MPRRLDRWAHALTAAALAGTLGACAASTVDGHGTAAAVATQAVPDGDGYLVTDPAGHYAVQMPGKPERTVRPGSIAGYDFTLYLSTVRAPYVALVEGEVVRPALPESDMGTTLNSALSSFQASSGMTMISHRDTTFNGHSAKSAVLDHAGERYQLLVTAYSGAQIYLLFAPEGEKFNQLASSFHAI